MKLATYIDIEVQNRDQCGVPPLLHNDIMITNSSACHCANLLKDYFSSIFTKENLDSMPNLPDLVIPEMEMEPSYLHPTGWC